MCRGGNASETSERSMHLTLKLFIETQNDEILLRLAAFFFLWKMSHHMQHKSSGTRK